MCSATKWFWPGLVTTAVLTALCGWFLAGKVEQDLALRAGDQLRAGQPWASVTFDGRDGVVAGIAENEIQQREAANIARSTYGVRIVGDKTVLPQAANPFVISLTKAGEGIQLKGNYSSTQSRLALIEAIEKSMPGIPVKDELVLASGKPDGFDLLAMFGVAQLADLASGEVALSNLEYTIKGLPAGLDVYEKLASAVSALPSGGILKSAEIALPELGKPYEIAASFDGTAVTLEGFAPSQDMRTAIEDTARELFSGKTVNNLLKLAGGAPDKLPDWVAFALERLSKLKDGSFGLAGPDLTISGNPMDMAGYEEAMAAMSGYVPVGLKITANNLVKPPEPEPAAQQQPAPAPVVEPSPEAKACSETIAGILAAGAINFETAKAIITAESFPVIEKIARTMKECPETKMEIGGHTDSNGDDGANQRLSDERAAAVLRWLLGFGVEAGRISARGYGETAPVAPNDSDENKAKNRRIEFRLVQ